MRKGDLRKRKNKIKFVAPIFIVLLICVCFIGIGKNNGNRIIKSENNNKLDDTLSGYMAEEIEKLKNEDDENLTSTKYLVAENLIKRVKENTDVKDFKNSFERNISVYTDETMDEEVTDGIIKTGMVVEYKEDLYTVIVDGDVSKDGKVDQIDISKMIRKETESKEKIAASDYGMERIIRKIVYGEYYLDEVKEVQSPKINIVGGQKGENDWYTTDVNINITLSDENSKKIVYKIRGTEEVDETEVKDGENIILNKDGIYKVIAYAYGEQGNKSKISTEIIKVNKTGIEAKISYSTKESTTDPVVATVSFNKNDITITNNDGKDSYKFTENGEFTFEYIDDTGRVGSITAIVDWIKRKELIGKDGEWKYCINSDGTIQLSQYMGTKSEITVPAIYDGYTVYSVGNVNATDEKVNRLNIFGKVSDTSLKKLTIENGIKEIKKSAFYSCSGIENNLELPESIEVIDNFAFSKCTGIKGELKFPSNLKYMGDAVFNSCSGITGNVNMPDSILSLGRGVFQSCTGLNGSIHLPEKLTELPDYLFNKCTNITGEVIFPKNLKSIGGYVFNQCSKLTGGLDIPDEVTSIGIAAFQSCNGLDKELKLPSKLKNIESYAFNQCVNLKGNIKIPEGVTKIDLATFQNCNNLEGNLELPSTLESIGGYAFDQCNNLTGDLIIPDNVETIGDVCFQGLTNMKGKLVLPKKIKSIGRFGFYDDWFTGELILPEGLETIGEAAFGRSNSFDNVAIVIPSTLKKIGIDYEIDGENLGLSTHDFYNFGSHNPKLERFEVASTNQYFKAVDGVLYTKNMKRLISYPRNKKDETYEIPEGVKTIDELSIASNCNLKTLIIPDSLSVEVKDKFIRLTNCHVLTSALYNYNAINNIVTKDTNPNYKSIDGVLYTKDLKELVFISSGRTSEVIIPDGVEKIRDGAVYWNQIYYIRVPKLYIPASVSSISDQTISTINNGFITKIEVSDNNESFTLNSEGKLIRK